MLRVPASGRKRTFIRKRASGRKKKLRQRFLQLSYGMPVPGGAGDHGEVQRLRKKRKINPDPVSLCLVAEVDAERGAAGFSRAQIPDLF